MKEIVLILDNVRSVHNVGSIFRTADAFGVSKIYCAGVTPTPTDRFLRERKDFAKVSLGAEKAVLWEKIPQADICTRKLKSEGFYVLALEQGRDSISCKEVPEKGKVALIVGSETEGVARNLLEIADALLELPMRGAKESLNVSVATGIALACLAGLSR